MIIVPAYNVEKYIKERIESIIYQKTKYSYQFVIVNDGSSDKTEEMLLNYSGIENIKIISQDNKGIAGARSSALRNITGKYLMFVDSDDILVDGSIDKLMNIATEFDADIVEGDFIRFKQSNDILVSNKISDINLVDPINELRGYPWGKVYKAFLFEKNIFPEGYIFEDAIIPRVIYSNKKVTKCIKTNDVVYGYRFNENSITNTYKNINNFDSYILTSYLMKWHSKNDIISTKTLKKFF